MRILSYNITHDSSVCVLKDGELEYFGKEERFSKIKRDRNPIKSLVTYFDNYNNELIDYSLFLTPSLDDVNESSKNLFDTIISKYRKVKTSEVYCYNSHHDLHAWLAFINSCYEQALVFVVDRNGACLYTSKNQFLAREAESVFLFNKEKNCVPVYKNFWVAPKVDFYEIQFFLSTLFTDCDTKADSSYSIVKVYEAATSLIGQHPLENGKTMGLASYGNSIESSYFDIRGRVNDSHFTHNSDRIESVIFKHYQNKITKDITKENYQFYANKAYEVQLQTQEQVLNLIKKYTDLYKIRNVCIVGGYGLNVVANNFYLENLPDINFYFEPVSDDTGIPIGACFKKYYELTKNFARPLKNNFYHFYNNKELIKEDSGEKTSIPQLVKLLIDQKSIGVFDGNPEAGPRALGHRSILFDARNSKGKDIINTIKKREWYRPFAGIILKSEFEKYFITNGLTDSEYMTIGFKCKDITKDFVPAIVHVDNTCRIQTIDKNNSFLFELLNEFFKETGCPFLLNTSLNLAGMPLVQTKQDAISMLRQSELDYVYFHDQRILVNAKKFR